MGEAKIEQVKRVLDPLQTLAGLVVILLTGMSYAIYAVAKQDALSSRQDRLADAMFRRDEQMLEISKAQLEVNQLFREELKEIRKEFSEAKSEISILNERTKKL